MTLISHTKEDLECVCQNRLWKYLSWFNGLNNELVEVECIETPDNNPGGQDQLRTSKTYLP